MAFALDPRTVASVRYDYLRPWVLKCPVIGNIQEADCFWVQAFGRNSYEDKSLGRILERFRIDAPKADEATFRLLERHKFDPGQPNYDISFKTMELAAGLESNGRIPLIAAQWENAYCLWVIDSQWYKKHCANIVTLWAPPDKEYYPSIEVIADAIRATQYRGLHQPAIVCHDAQRVRVLGICWRQGWSPIVPEQYILSFDAKSVQKKTRSYGHWWPHEMMARTHHLVFRHASLIPPQQAR